MRARSAAGVSAFSASDAGFALWCACGSALEDKGSVKGISVGLKARSRRFETGERRVPEVRAFL
jgi:hypothetical protein